MKKLTNRTRMLAAAAVTGALLVPAALLGGAQAAVSVAQYAYGSHAEYGGSGSQYQYRVPMCHRTGSRKHGWHTITVSIRAVRAHLRHGDHLGACTGNEPFVKHGHGKGHGKGHGNGKGDGEHEQGSHSGGKSK